jgi:[protein-PII] uridylyltransferase
MDGALRELFEDGLPFDSRVAIAAVGGYGRGQLSPHSDVDLLFVIPRRADADAGALKKVLYPLWDAGWQVGHAVVTPALAIERGQSDIESATALLTMRSIGGDDDLYEELIDRRTRWIAKDGRKLARRLRDATTERHKAAQRAGWALAPDLKDDVGGLRDAHAVGWLATLVDDDAADDELVAAAELLTAVREALHAQVKRKLDRLRIDLQPRVASYLELEGGDAVDELMTRVHSAARVIEHRSHVLSEMLAEKLLGGPRRSGLARRLGASVRIDDGLLQIDADTDEASRAVELLAIHSETGRRVARSALAKLQLVFANHSPGRWDGDTRTAFLRLLQGDHAPSALELMEHLGAWQALLPEWKTVRGRAQHDPYHRFTVDGHSFVCVGAVTRAQISDPIAPAAMREAGDADALYLAALLHDVGKGSGEDHSVAGERIAQAICTRIGLDDSTTQDVATLVRHHLLLADTATRRDLDDGNVIERTAKQIGEPRRLRHLYVLTVADAVATGPEAWTDWKAALVRELYRKTLVALETGEIPARTDAVVKAQQIEAYEPALAGRVEEVLSTLPASYLESAQIPDMADEVRLLLQAPASGQVRHRVDDIPDSPQVAVTICAPDRPGTLARAAGVLALNQISVRSAQAYATSNGYALERFIVEAGTSTDWTKFEKDLQDAYSGRLAVEPHLGVKARDYAGGRVVPEIRVLQEASPSSTVVEVRARDAVGLLYAITSGLSDLDLDIHVAKIDTLGERVVDVFYVRTLWGSKLDAQQEAEVDRSIKHRVERLLG